MWISLCALGALALPTASVASKEADTDWHSGPEFPPSDFAPEVPPCREVVGRYQSSPVVASSPPREMPADMVSAFTAGGAIETAEFYVDDTINGQGSHYQYPAADVEHMITSAKEYIDGKRSTQRLPPMDQWIIEALRRHPLKGKSVIVFGSMSPWYEAIAVAAGADTVTTVEYNNLTYTHPRMFQTTPRNLLPPPTGFDVALSISSFDHDGLGRYGDPVHPNGDLFAMEATRCLLRPGGLMVLTVPVGPDVVAWNLHRRYGRVRLPLLLRGWNVVDTVGWSWRRFEAPADYRRSYEPVFVLQSPLQGLDRSVDASGSDVKDEF